MKCAVDDTIEYIKNLARRLELTDTPAVVLIVLLKLGIPTNYDGFEYLRIAILMRCENPLCTMVNDVYPRICALSGRDMTGDMIEAAMRGAIKAAWKRSDRHTWRLLLPTLLAEEEKRPSNKELIDELARIVELLCRCAAACGPRHSREEVGCGIE